MLQKDQRARQDRRACGEAQSPEARVPTYQDLLDAALDDTFPASDPISTSAGSCIHAPHTTARDCSDWTLRPGGAGDECERSARCEARLERPLEIGGVHIPAGPCGLEQSDCLAFLFWCSAGVQRRTEMDLESLRGLLASGQLWRKEAT